MPREASRLHFRHICRVRAAITLRGATLIFEGDADAVVVVTEIL